MTRRRGLLTLSDMAVINGVDEVLNLPLIVELLPELRTMDLFYTSMLQTGIDCIEIPSDVEFVSVSPLLKKHLAFGFEHEWLQAFIVVHEFFKCHMPSFFQQNPDGEGEYEDYDVFDLYSFLVRLLCALTSGRNLINLGTFPDVGKLAGKLPPEVLVPVTNLLTTFDKVVPSSPFPRVTVDKDNVALFQDILVSQRFTQYKTAHSTFEDQGVLVETSSQHVSQAARSIYGHSRKLVKMRKLLVAVLPFSSRIVDMVFGSLPGKLAEQFTRVAQDWLNRNQRLVIYQMDGVSEQLLTGRIDAFVRARLKRRKKRN